MALTSTYVSRQRARKYARKRIIEGKTQMKAYKETFPNQKTPRGNASMYEHKGYVQEALNKYIDQIDEREIKGVVASVVRDAKGSKKDVLWGTEGNVKQIRDNQATIASREQLFKLVGHPAFSKTIHIDNRAVYIGKDTADELIEAIKGVSMETIECDQAGDETAFS